MHRLPHSLILYYFRDTLSPFLMLYHPILHEKTRGKTQNDHDRQISYFHNNWIEFPTQSIVFCLDTHPLRIMRVLLGNKHFDLIKCTSLWCLITECFASGIFLHPLHHEILKMQRSHLTAEGGGHQNPLVLHLKLPHKLYHSRFYLYTVFFL